jgi:Fis family transcriptional regulator
MTSSQAFTPSSTLPESDTRAAPASGDDGISAPGDDMLLRDAVDAAMRRYFAHLDGCDVTDLHAMVIAEVEAPLLASVLDHAQGNQTRAAEMLGLNRGTLRKKLKHYALT